VAGLWTLAVVVVVLAAVTVAVSLTKSRVPAPSARSTTTSTTSSPGTTAPASGSSPPTISSLTPSTGSPGQSVLISGTDFLSANGQIVASFGGVMAPTSCSSSTSCTATVPAQRGANSHVQVTITTDTGMSAGVWFIYR